MAEFESKNQNWLFDLFEKIESVTDQVDELNNFVNKLLINTCNNKVATSNNDNNTAKSENKNQDWLYDLLEKVGTITKQLTELDGIIDQQIADTNRCIAVDNTCRDDPRIIDMISLNSQLKGIQLKSAELREKAFHCIGSVCILKGVSNPLPKPDINNDCSWLSIDSMADLADIASKLAIAPPCVRHAIPIERRIMRPHRFVFLLTMWFSWTYQLTTET